MRGPGIERHRWVWAAAGVLVLWAALSVSTNRFGLQSLSGVLASASFLAIVSIGQMFAISTGGGNCDLSMPSVITLSAFLTVGLVGGSNIALLWGLPVVLFLGLAVGAVNAILVLRLRIPAIIATLAVGYVLATGTLLANQTAVSFSVSPLLAAVAASRVAGMPTILPTALVLCAASALLIGRTAYGRRLMALGQSERAAALAGVRVNPTATAAFLISGALAALDGALLSAHAGGAFLEMGAPYLLQSVGAVVVGGTLIFGGSATALGTFLGSVLLILIVTTMQIMGLPAGAQDVVEGAVIIAVLAAAGAGRRAR
ncbi:MAG: ABC transporter permease [Acetobacteraceae bacterium]